MSDLFPHPDLSREMDVDMPPEVAHLRGLIAQRDRERILFIDHIAELQRRLSAILEIASCGRRG